MSDDFMKPSSDANSGHNALEKPGDPDIRAKADRDLSRDFNLPSEYGEQLAKLSPEARKKVETIVEEGNDRLPGFSEASSLCDKSLGTFRRSGTSQSFLQSDRRPSGAG